MKVLQPMTQEERDFAEERHNLVIHFLRSKRLPMDDYYDIVIFGYLSAVQRYMRDRPAGVSFEAVAFRSMKDALYQNHEYNIRAKRCGYTVSLENWDNHAAIPDPKQDTERQVADKVLLEQAVNAATPNEVPIIRMLIEGYRLIEAAQFLRISKGAACVRMQRFYRRARAAIG